MHLMGLLGLGCAMQEGLSVEDSWVPVTDAELDPPQLLEASRLPMRWAELVTTQAAASRDACPSVSLPARDRVLLSGGCTDAQGVAWTGTATLYAEDGQERIDLQAYGTPERQVTGTLVLAGGLTLSGSARFLDQGDLEIHYQGFGVTDWAAWQAMERGDPAHTALRGDLELRDHRTRSSLEADGSVSRSEWASCGDGPEYGTLSISGHPDGEVRFMWYPESCGQCVDWRLNGERGQICG